MENKKDMCRNQNNMKENEKIVYSKEDIELLLNLINSTSFKGIQQIQLIAQISAVLGNPINMLSEENKETK